MSPVILRWSITAVFVFHGVGQLMGAVPALGLYGVGSGKGPEWMSHWSARSWLFTDLLGTGPAKAIAAVLFIAGFAGFISAAFSLNSLIIRHDLWRTLVIVSSFISLTAILFYWNALILLFPHKIGNIAVNLAALTALLVLSWPTESMIGY